MSDVFRASISRSRPKGRAVAERVRRSAAAAAECAKLRGARERRGVAAVVGHRAE